MSDITDWIRQELYPVLYECIDTALPEHSFKRSRGGDWISGTYLDGAKHKRADKTVITKKAPGRILEQGGDNISLVDYVIRRDSVTFIEAVKTLATAAGLQVPSSADYDSERYKKIQDKASVLETCNSYFTALLRDDPAAQGVRDYLRGNRGYTDQEVEDMGLGYAPDQEDLYRHLRERGFSQDQIQEAISLNKAIGHTHRLTIPFRSAGSLQGFIVRTISGAEPKYLVSTGLKRGETFFNISPLKGDKDLIIVEGYLDALISEVKGVDNVVGLGGARLTADQVQDAISRGARSFTICLDGDGAGAEGVRRGIDLILEQGVDRIYTVTLPELEDGVKADPDSLIRAQGVESFKRILSDSQTCLPYYLFWLQDTISRYGRIQEEKGELSPKDQDRLLEEIQLSATKISSPVDRVRYLKAFTDLEAIRALGITQESLEMTVDRLQDNKDKEAQRKELSRLIAEAGKLQSLGQSEDVISLLQEGVAKAKLKSGSAQYSKLTVPTSEQEVIERLSQQPDSLETQYLFSTQREGYKPLLIPAGALSIIVAPTSHGKTSFLLNLGLDIANGYPDKEVYFFSYEEDRDSVLISALSIYLGEMSANNRRSIRDVYKTGSLDKIRRGQRDEFVELSTAFYRDLIATGRLSIHYSTYDSDTLTGAIRHLYKTANPGAICIDYLQLLRVRAGKFKTYSRQEEVKEICMELKEISVETGLPIILGAQFNREVCNPERMSPIRIGEAGDIERVANLIIGFWNGNFDPPLSMMTQAESDLINQRGSCEPNQLYATILKNRAGEVGGVAKLRFNGSSGRISNTVSDQEEKTVKG